MDKQQDDRRVKLDMLHSFGSSCSQGYRDSVGILEDEGNKKLIYPVGKFLAIKPLDQQQMQHVKLSQNIERIQSMTISPNKKVVAVCERPRDFEEGQNRYPTVSVYYLKSGQVRGNLNPADRKQFSYADTQCQSFISMAFSNQSRFLVCLTGQPQHKIVYFDLNATQKDIASASLNAPVTKISISPKDNHTVGITGKGVFQILRVQESVFQPLVDNLKGLPPEWKEAVYTDHVWLEDGKTVISNDRGELMVVSENEVLYTIEQVFRNKGVGVVCMVPLSRGGIVAASEKGEFSLFLKNEESASNNGTGGKQGEDQEKLVYMRSWDSQRHVPAYHMDITSNDDLLAISFKNNDIAHFQLSKILPLNSESVESMRNSEKYRTQTVQFIYAFKGFHFGPITSLDVCVHRPLFITCSQKDSSIRVWNYLNFRCEIARCFAIESPDGQPVANVTHILNCVAFHPSGYYIAAGFIDQLRFFYVMHNEFREFREGIILKNTTQLRFSNGGQLIAAAASVRGSQQNQYGVNIYNSYTLEIVHHFKGPNHIVTQLVWDPRDRFVAASCLDGNLYQWMIYGNEQNEDRMQAQFPHKLFSLVYNETIPNFLAAGGDGNQGIVNEYFDINPDRERREQREMHEPPLIPCNSFRITNFTLSRSIFNFTCIIAGTNTGTIKVFPEFFDAIPFENIPVHTGEISRIRCSPDGRYAISCGEDGAIFVFQIQDLDADGVPVSQTRTITGANNTNTKLTTNPLMNVTPEDLQDVVMVPRSEIEYYLMEQKQLAHVIEDLENRLESQILDEKYKIEKLLNKKKQEMNNEIRTWSNRYQELQKQKQILELQSGDLIEKMESENLKRVIQIEDLYERKLALENEKYLQIEQDLMQEKDKFQKQLQSLTRKHETNINELQNRFSENFMQSQKVYETTKGTAEDLQQIYEQRLSQQEEEHQMEIRDRMDQHNAQIEMMQKDMSKLKSEKEKVEKEKLRLKEEQEKLEKAEKMRNDDFQALNQKFKDALHQLEIQKKLTQEQEDLALERNKKINQYQNQINDLQKSKHVLSFRTTEMRKSLEPKEAQIDQLQQELFSLEGELEQMLKSNQVQTETIKKLNNQIGTIDQNYQKQVHLTKNEESQKNQIIMDIHNIINDIDPIHWAQHMRTLYQKYVKNQEIKQKNQDQQSIEEMVNQISHLDKKILQMNISSEKIIIRRENEIYKQTKENAQLIYDLNDLRKQFQELTTESNNLRSELQGIKDQLGKREEEINKFKASGLWSPDKPVSGDLPLPGQSEGSLPGRMMYQSSSRPNFGNLNSDDNLENNLNTMPISSSKKNLASQQKIGNVLQGPNFDTQGNNTFNKLKMWDLMADLEITHNQLVHQELATRQLRTQIRRHLHERGCNDLELQEEAAMLNINENPGVSLPIIQPNPPFSQPQPWENSDMNNSRPFSSGGGTGNLVPIQK